MTQYIAAARLMTPLDIYERTTTRNTTGEVVSSYVKTTSTRGNIIRKRGDVLDRGEQLIYVYPVVIQVRRYVVIPEFALVSMVVAGVTRYYVVDSVTPREDLDVADIAAHSVDSTLITITPPSTPSENGE